MATINHIIFDLDGTLLDTIPDLLFNMNRTFSELRLPGEFSDKEMASFVGSGKDEQIRRAMKARKIAESEFKRINGLLSVYYAENTSKYTLPFPEVHSVLKELETRGKHLYIATNKPESIAKEVVKHFFPDINFLLVRGDRGDGIIKPNPNFLGSVIKKIASPLTEIIFIGDSNVDFLAAKNAGLKCYIVPYGYDMEVMKVKDKKLVFLKKLSDLLQITE